MGYVFNLSDSDICLLLTYIKDSKYSEMTLVLALVVFARDYLNSIDYNFDETENWAIAQETLYKRA